MEFTGLALFWRGGIRTEGVGGLSRASVLGISFCTLFTDISLKLNKA